jgi:hypothetical protein
MVTTFDTIGVVIYINSAIIELFLLMFLTFVLARR